MGDAVELEPTDALLACVQRAAGQAAWLRLKVEDLGDEDVLTVGAHGSLVAHTWGGGSGRGVHEAAACSGGCSEEEAEQ